MQFSICLYTNHSETRNLYYVLSKPSLLYQCEKSFTSCGNGLSPVLDLQKWKWPETLLVGAASQAEVCTDLVQIAKTDLDAELLLEGCLHYTAWSAGRRVAVGFQPGPLVRSQLGRVPVSSILAHQLSHSSAPGAAADRPSND